MQGTTKSKRLTLPASMHDACRDLAKAQGESLASWIRGAIRARLRDERSEVVKSDEAWFRGKGAYVVPDEERTRLGEDEDLDLRDGPWPTDESSGDREP